MQGFVLLIIVLVVIGLGWRAWSVYSGTFRSRRDEEAAREHALLEEARGLKLASPESPQPKRQPVVQAQTSPPNTGPAQAAILDPVKRAALLNLRLSLREYEILPAVDVALIAGPDAMAPRVCIDFLVCDRSFKPLSAIFVDDGSESDLLRERAIKLASRRGVRIVRWVGSALPTRDQMAAQVLGTA